MAEPGVRTQTEAAQAVPACRICRYWAPAMRGETAREGICRKLLENPGYYGSLVTEPQDKCDQWARPGVYTDAEGATADERRHALRSRINLAARLRTARGVQSVWLADLSTTGAGISMHNPPGEGMPGVLEWGPYQVFFTVAWATEDACGVTFDTAISSEVVYEAIRDGALKNDRSAEPTRIAKGVKRSSLFHREAGS